MGAARVAAGAAAMVVVALTAPAFSQSAAPPAFEMADVRVSPPRMNVLAGMAGGAIRNGLYEVRNATTLDLIRTAYGVQGLQVVDGPSWLEVDIFDVVGKVPAGITVEQARLMLRGVLADRWAGSGRREADRVHHPAEGLVRLGVRRGVRAPGAPDGRALIAHRDQPGREQGVRRVEALSGARSSECRPSRLSTVTRSRSRSPRLRPVETASNRFSSGTWRNSSRPI